ncbi:MAG: twin-arginine translocation signal domain-containing protein, partial [Acidobacteriia bacterium]|nr:twin-arginine translocation signal domain-containing protein [Terriglobia bacterium]
MAKSPAPSKAALGRRNFLKTAAGGTAVLASNSQKVEAQEAAPVRAAAAVAPKELDPSSAVEVLTADRPGSDFMVEVIKALGFEYVCANPGSSFRALHESVINYGGNSSPEFITCCHEESSIAMAHGYAKMEGKPLLVFAHGAVGLQHAAMAIYNAYCDRVPVYVVVGNSID